MTRGGALARTTLVALLLALAGPTGSAMGAAPRADLVDLEDEVMCVTCKVPLNIAEGAQPDSQRAFIRGLIAQGSTKDEIKRALVMQYGDQVLALPDDSGFGITAYAIPLALGALMVAGLALLAPRWRRRPAAGIADPARGDLSASDAKRLDEDLARYEA